MKIGRTFSHFTFLREIISQIVYVFNVSHVHFHAFATDFDVSERMATADENKAVNVETRIKGLKGYKKFIIFLNTSVEFLRTFSVDFSKIIILSYPSFIKFHEHLHFAYAH